MEQDTILCHLADKFQAPPCRSDTLRHCVGRFLVEQKRPRHMDNGMSVHPGGNYRNLLCMKGKRIDMTVSRIIRNTLPFLRHILILIQPGPSKNDTQVSVQNIRDPEHALNTFRYDITPTHGRKQEISLLIPRPVHAQRQGDL